MHESLWYNLTQWALIGLLAGIVGAWAIKARVKDNSGGDK